MERKYLIYSSIILTIAILVGSLAKLNHVEQEVFEISDKGIHSIAYCILTLNWMVAFKSIFKNATKRLLISIGILTYGIIIEVLQGVFTTYRQADIKDVFANLVGIIIANLFFFYLYGKNK